MNGSSNRSTAAPVQNPYARKKPSCSNAAVKNTGPAGTSTHRPNSLQQQQQPHDPPPKRTPHNPYASSNKKSVSTTAMETANGTTFSQAFGAIDETEYFQRGQQQQTTSKNSNTDRAQQRAFEEATAKMSDRDHHEFLQPHVLYISYKQRGNGVINFIRNVPYEYSRLVPDYIMNRTTCALFLSCKYHQLHGQYIYRRIAELKTDFRLRILLVLVDLEDNAIVLQQLNKLAVLHNMTLILAWSEEEAARYLETYKYAEGNDASLIQRKEKTNFVDQATEFLAGAQGVNKTDAASLLSQFTSVKAIMAASKEELGLVPGLGQVKVKRLHDAFHKPFSSKRAREQKKQKEEEEARKENSELKGDNKQEEDVKETNNKLEGQKEEDATEKEIETKAG